MPSHWCTRLTRHLHIETSVVVGGKFEIWHALVIICLPRVQKLKFRSRQLIILEEDCKFPRFSIFHTGIKINMQRLVEKQFHILFCRFFLCLLRYFDWYLSKYYSSCEVGPDWLLLSLFCRRFMAFLIDQLVAPLFCILPSFAILI